MIHLKNSVMSYDKAYIMFGSKLFTICVISFIVDFLLVKTAHWAT
jgi:hypothetical protein